MGVTAGFASACLLAAPAGAVPSTPLSGSQTQSWDVSPAPACHLTQGWDKQPGGFNVQRVQLTGVVSCSSVPGDIGGSVEVRVSDLAGNPLKQPLIDSTAYLSASTPAVSLTPVLYGPRAGHTYLYEFLVSVWGWAMDVRSAPRQCTYNSNGNDPLGMGGPTSGFVPPSEDCAFYQEVAVP